jgi:hypothetical protein
MNESTRYALEKCSAVEMARLHLERNEFLLEKALDKDVDMEEYDKYKSKILAESEEERAEMNTRNQHRR